MVLGGYGVMVAPQPSKLMVRVRFPLPAPVFQNRFRCRGFVQAQVILDLLCMEVSVCAFDVDLRVGARLE